jgi:hypothetical protein
MSFPGYVKVAEDELTLGMVDDCTVLGDAGVLGVVGDLLMLEFHPEYRRPAPTTSIINPTGPSALKRNAWRLPGMLDLIIISETPTTIAAIPTISRRFIFPPTGLAVNSAL